MTREAVHEIGVHRDCDNQDTKFGQAPSEHDGRERQLLVESCTEENEARDDWTGRELISKKCGTDESRRTERHRKVDGPQPHFSQKDTIVALDQSIGNLLALSLSARV